MKYDTLADVDSIEKVIQALAARNVTAEIVENAAAALESIKELIPKGVSVMNGSSTTMKEIGYLEYLKSAKHGWKDLSAAVQAEEDPAKRASLRMNAVISDYYIGSVHALSQNGEFVVASGTGSQLPHLAYTSKNVILVVGAQKITPDLASAIKRIWEYVLPLENKRMHEMGRGDSLVSKMLIFEREHPMTGRKFHLLIVNEKLGF